jgi:hypothetical protein
VIIHLKNTGISAPSKYYVTSRKKLKVLDIFQITWFPRKGSVAQFNFSKKSRLVENPFWGTSNNHVGLSLPGQITCNAATAVITFLPQNQTVISSVADPSSPNEGRQGVHCENLKQLCGDTLEYM